MHERLDKNQEDFNDIYYMAKTYIEEGEYKKGMGYLPHPQILNHLCVSVSICGYILISINPTRGCPSSAITPRSSIRVNVILCKLFSYKYSRESRNSICFTKEPNFVFSRTKRLYLSLLPAGERDRERTQLD